MVGVMLTYILVIHLKDYTTSLSLPQLVQSPEVPWKFMTKRLIAMEGQSVTYVVDSKNSDKSETVVVPKGHVWIEGENIYESNDSRKFGAVPYGLLQGRVFWRIWPPKDFGSLAQNKGKDSIS
ncbi:mitochondrial inner membrane protease subunit 1-like [Prunus avium]|uniref:Mitochondrial inner membrane protease subunit 1-like n=1 Tax=Prunus avium TaxID=42229 RepID=A0A6P5SP03_PRUAV|nr:mitochondrial inner membrane protease subunit 1-like [Prunus avium]